MDLKTMDALDSGKLFAEYPKSGFNFDNCRR